MLSKSLWVACLSLLILVTACVNSPHEMAPVVVVAPPPPPEVEAEPEEKVVPLFTLPSLPKPTTPKVVEAPQPSIKKVTTVDGIEGEIEGSILPRSKFAKLQIGMTQLEVQELIGRPTNISGYVGKAFVPPSTKNKTFSLEAVYKGEGRLIFAPASKFSNSLFLIRITANPKEGSY